jgi:hypothetical protein
MTQIRPLCGRLVGITPLALLTVLSPAPTDAQQPFDPDSLLSEIGRITMEVAPQVDSIWPGVWSEDRQIALYPYQSGSLLVGSDAGTYAGQVVPLTRADDGLTVQLWYLPGYQPYSSASGPYTFDFPLGGAGIFGFSYVTSLTHFSDPLEASLVLLYHELFHFYQLAQWAEPSLDVEKFLEVAAYGGHAAAAAGDREQERELLIAALETDRHTEQLDLLARYYAQLDCRAPRPLRIGDEFAERLEGTASWFAYEALARAQGRGADLVTTLLIRDLRAIFPEDEPRGEAGLVNWHMYVAGAAKAALADRLTTNWQGRVAAGATLDDVLLDALEQAGAPGVGDACS